MAGSIAFQSLVIKCSISGTILGLLAAEIERQRLRLNACERLDLEKGMGKSTFTNRLYFFWPFLVILAIGFRILWTSPPIWQQNQFLFQLILFGAMLSYYPAKSGDWKLGTRSLSLPIYIGLITLILANYLL